MTYEDILYKNYKLIYNSCLFDREWYVKEYFKAYDSTFEPIFHYLIEGSDNGYNPNAFFDTNYYLNMNKDVKKAGINPLLHYVKHGKKEGRKFSNSVKLTGNSLEEHIFLNKNPNLLFAINKIKELDLFDNDYYLENNKEIKQSNVDPLIHYLSIGHKEHKNPSEKFDNDYYLNKNLDLKHKNMNPLIHYVLYGISQNKLCVPKKNDFNELTMSEKINFLNKRINELELKFNNEVNKKNDVLNSYYELLNIIYLNNIKAKGILRLVQLHSIELLKFVTTVCEKNNLTYWLDYGTLIGAIRHDGFVPWDDEIDISMPREDYQKIIKIIPKELKRLGVPKRIYLRIGHASFKGVTTNGDSPSPIAQFIDEIPLAHVDIHTLDYYNITANNAKSLFGDEKLFDNAVRTLRYKLNTGEYKTFEEGHYIEGKKIGITNTKTNFLGSPLDGIFRTPIRLHEIFPLIKKSYEGYEFFIPKNAIKYLQSSYYSGDIMKIPPIIRMHNGANFVQRQLNYENYEKKYQDVLKLWRDINSKI